MSSGLAATSARLPRNVAVVVVTPDVAAQGLWEVLAQRLSILHLGVLAATSLMMTPQRQSRLYAHGTFKQGHGSRKPSTAWVSYAFGELDSSVVAVVRTPFDVDLVGLLDAWKGSSSFGRRTAGDVRSISPAAHRCFSVLHTPDDAEQAYADVASLLETWVADDVCSARAAERCSFQDLGLLRMARRGVPAAHPYDMVVRSVVRVLAVLAYDYATAPSMRWTDALQSALSVFGSCGEWGHGGPDHVAERWSVAAAQLAAVTPPAVALHSATEPATAARRTVLRAALADLLSPACYATAACERVEDAFALNDLFLDPWERHELRIAMAFPLR